METAVIVDAVRTPLGRRNGVLSGWHPAELAAEVLTALADRTGVDPGRVDDVIVGCMMQVGAQALNIARTAVLSAGWPESVPATTVDRQCGSSQQAAHFAAQGVLAGAYDLAIAAGVEVMSLVPLGSSTFVKDVGQPFPPPVIDRYAADGGLQPLGVAADRLASHHGLTRAELDAVAVTSHQRATRARDEGRLRAEIVPVDQRMLDRDNGKVVAPNRTITDDEAIGSPSADELATLAPAFDPDGLVTAGNSAQLADGAAAVLICRESVAAELGLTPRARFRSFALAGVDPVAPVTGAVPATLRALDRAGLDAKDIDVFEVNETSAATVLVWARELGIDLERVNPNGGAIAVGHPLGCSGARLLTTLVHELEAVGGRFGLQAMSEGGGQANATIIEQA